MSAHALAQATRWLADSSQLSNAFFCDGLGSYDSACSRTAFASEMATLVSRAKSSHISLDLLTSSGTAIAKSIFRPPPFFGASPSLPRVAPVSPSFSVSLSLLPPSCPVLLPLSPSPPSRFFAAFGFPGLASKKSVLNDWFPFLMKSFKCCFSLSARFLVTLLPSSNACDTDVVTSLIRLRFSGIQMTAS